MILTCPSCGTQYVVKDGAIPPNGRQVRCKACQHSWREFPPAVEETLELEREVPVGEFEDQPAAEALDEPREPFAEHSEIPDDNSEPAGQYPVYSGDEPIADEPGRSPIPPETDVVGLAESAPSHRLEWVERDEDFTPFARQEPKTSRSGRRLIVLGVLVVLIAALAAGLWFFAPSELKQRLGIANASETPLQLMMTHTDRSPLASGNDLLNISGRIINPTDEQQKVPPIFAQLHDGSGKVVYKWTIPPPMKSLPPGGSASFNSAELNIPQAAQDLTVSLGEPKI